MRGVRSLALLALAALLAIPFWGCGSNRSSDGSQAAAQTPEEILRATSFVGADRCGGCHETIHDGWEETAHTQKLRDGSLEVNYVNDNAGASPDGRSDFFQGADVDIRTLAGGSKFDRFGAEAPFLGSSGGQAYIKINNVQYDIVFTLGGSAVQNADFADGNPLINNSTDDGLILNEEAQWKQRYITKIGNSNYILPVQYNVDNQEYTTYHPEDWWENEANYDPAVDDPMNPGTSRSYERRCAGCHVTGLEVTFLPATEEWTMTFSDISVACEACHGPGGQHATSPTDENIINPDTLTTTLDLNGDNTVDAIDNLIIRNWTCYPCHSRGSGKHSVTGASGTQTLAFSSKTGPDGSAQMYLPGLDWREFYDVTTSANSYWGGDPTSGNFITSKQHHQQQQDHEFGPHGADNTFDHACHECHELHFAEKEHLVASELERDGIEIDNGTGFDDNAVLCLNCHTGRSFDLDEFQGLTVFDYKDGPDFLTAATETAIRTHMDDRAYMAVGFELSCERCHMPDTAQTALEGDIKSHTFNIIWPNYVMQSATFSWNGFNPTPMDANEWPTTKFQPWYTNSESFTPDPAGDTVFSTVGFMPNSCLTGDCHSGETWFTDDIVTEWYRSGHADGFGEAFNHWNADGSVSASCVKCHTQGGYIQFVNGEELTAQSVVFPKVLGCESCHEPGGGGDTFFDAGKVQEVVFPANEFAPVGQEATFAVETLNNSSNLCMECHQGRESGLTVADATPTGTETGLSFINRHYFAAAAIMFGADVVAGYEYAGRTYLGATAWPGIHGSLDTCTGCHLRGAEDHHFEPELSDCSACHTDVPGGMALTDFDLLGLPFGAAGAVDYDGDTIGESFQGEIDGMEELLLTQIQAYAAGTIGTPIVYGAGSYPYWFIDTDADGIADAGEINFGNRYVELDATLLRAAYNYHSAQDPCSDIHNYMYVIQTIYDSIDDLDGGGLNNSVTGTSVAATRP